MPLALNVEKPIFGTLLGNIKLFSTKMCTYIPVKEWSHLDHWPLS